MSLVLTDTFLGLIFPNVGHILLPHVILNINNLHNYYLFNTDIAISLAFSFE